MTIKLAGAMGNKALLSGFHLSFDHWHSTDSPENVELSHDIYRRLKKAGLIYAKPIEQFYDPVQGMFLAGIQELASGSCIRRRLVTSIQGGDHEHNLESHYCTCA